MCICGWYVCVLYIVSARVCGLKDVLNIHCIFFNEWIADYRITMGISILSFEISGNNVVRIDNSRNIFQNWKTFLLL